MHSSGAENPLEIHESESVLQEVYHHLYGEYCREIDLEKRMRLDKRIHKIDSLCRPNNPLFYSYSRLHEYCVDNRLQFRKLNEFSGKIPSRVLVEVKSLEEQLGKRVGPFWIMAQSEVFRKDDSKLEHVLFAQIGYMEFYRIASWGQAPTKYRPLLVFPLKNTAAMLVSIIALSLITTLIFPVSIYRGISENSIAWWTLHIWLFLVAIATYSWLTLRIFRRTNSEQWKG